MMKNRIKVQGTRRKVKGSRFSPCTLHLALCTSALQRGFSLVSAIFLLVVIAALGTFAVTLSTTQQQSAALDVMGSRAYQAARAGIEWGAYQVLQNGSCTTTTLAPLPNTLSGFNVNVVCNSIVNNEAGVIVTLYQLTSKAQQGVAGTPGFVERQISVSIAR